MPTNKTTKKRARHIQKVFGVAYTTALRTVQALDTKSRALAAEKNITLHLADEQLARFVLQEAGAYKEQHGSRT